MKSVRFNLLGISAVYVIYLMMTTKERRYFIATSVAFAELVVDKTSFTATLVSAACRYYSKVTMFVCRES